MGYIYFLTEVMMWSSWYEIGACLKSISTCDNPSTKEEKASEEAGRARSSAARRARRGRSAPGRQAGDTSAAAIDMPAAGGTGPGWTTALRVGRCRRRAPRRGARAAVPLAWQLAHRAGTGAHELDGAVGLRTSTPSRCSTRLHQRRGAFLCPPLPV